MAQRLVLTANEGLIPMHELQSFVQTALDYEQRGSSATYDLSDGELRIMLTLPKDVKVVGKKVVRLKPKTKKESEVDKQISTHKEKKKNGENEGYVPPVGRKTPPKKKTAKCPVCGVKKQVVTISKVRTIKPHISKGEPCAGGGQQVGVARAKGK